MKMIWIIALVFAGCQYLNFDTGIFSSIALTPTPAPIISLFAGDTCAPPCWFGLTAGESTAAEVLAFLESHADLVYWNTDFHSNVFDPQSGLLIDGGYYVQWWDSECSEQYCPETRIVVREGILSRMEIYTPHPQVVLVDEVLAKLGQPDLIRFGFELYREPIITFEYHTIPVRVFFTGEHATCGSMIDLVDKVWVNRVDYLPPGAPAATIWRESIPGSDPIVPLETWQQWRRNEVEDIPCHDMVLQLLESDTP